MVVYLVGAGPGDIGLVTLKAKQLIETAEVLVYDKLVNKEVLKWAKPECELIYVGKREDTSDPSQKIQKDINEILVQYGKDKKMVRLKGGDPFIFGRGGEEAQECVKHGIPFEVVPGISSAFAVPAYAGIPVSHRDYNSSFAVLTGHESEKDGSQIDWVHLPENIVVLMGVAQIKNTANALLNSGRSPETPVGAIHSGTTISQKTEILTLKKLAEEGVALKPPVIFVIGPVAELHNELTWFEKKMKSARGKKVVLTSTEAHMDDMKLRLEEYGFEVIPMPLIKLTGREFEVPDLNDYDALVFTSQEGIKRVEGKVDLKGFNGKVFAIGPKTRDMLEDVGVKASIGEKYNSEGLAEHISKNLETGGRIIALRSSAATSVMKDMLSTKYEVEEIPIYDVEQLPADPELITGADAVFVMSASCAKSLNELPAETYQKIQLVAIGPETSRNLNLMHLTSPTHTISGMIDAYIDFLWTGLK
jgi:uroporphyrinogen III methyltransferase/synthase